MGLSVGLSPGAAVDVPVGLSVDKPVGRSVVPRLAVEIVVENAVELAVDFAVDLAVEIVMASAMGLHGVPRHSVEAHGMPVEALGRSAVAVECPRLSVERRGNSRRMPWRSVDTATVLRQKDKSCTSL